MSEALYLSDPYIKEWEAEVTEVNKEKYIILDKTAFYPVGGGQPHDTGTITANGIAYNVIFVGKFSGKISHEVDNQGLNKGDIVKCLINWERRYKLMRMHTTAHIIAQMFFRETGALITGGQLDVDKSRMDMSIEAFNSEKLQEYENKVNEIIQKNLDVTFKTLPREVALKDLTLFKLAKGFPEEIKEIRIVSISDYDIQADGGCHVKNTREIGTVRFLEFANKGKNNRRIYYTVE